MKKLKDLKRQLELPTRNHILIWKLAKRITALEQEKRPTPKLPEGYYINEQGDLMQGSSLVIYKNHAKHKEALIAFLKGAR